MNHEPDPYDIITNMKWTPSCGEVNLNHFKLGSKVTVVTRGTFITDNQGSLISNSPEETQTFCNLLNHMWEKIVTPEVKKRKESGLPIPFPLESVTVLFDLKNNNKIFKYNEECGLRGQMRLRPNISIKDGENICFDKICDIDKVEPPILYNRPVAFLMYTQSGKQISLYGDFRPNDPNFCEDEWKDEEIWLADALLETWLARSFGHLSLLIPQLRRYDVPFTIGLKSENIKKMCEIIKDAKTSDEFDKRLSKVLTIKEAGSLIDNWLTLKAFQMRKEILLDVFKCFRCGIHSGVITILMSQVEGIITGELISKQKGIDKSGNPKHWRPDLINDFKDLVVSEDVGRLTLRILDGLITFLQNSNLYKRFSWTEENTGINRHASLHGKDFSFNTRANSVRMILLFDALYWIFLALQTSRSQEGLEFENQSQ